VALISTCLGLYAFTLNRVSHNRSFSAIMAATRSLDIDAALSQSHYVGTGSLPKKLGETKIKFDIFNLILGNPKTKKRVMSHLA
jgi:hypothetical protein